jgi:phosphoserine phosphatase RsbU/P
LKRNLSDIFISFNIVSWLLLLLINLYTLLNDSSRVVFGSGDYLRSMLLNFFLLCSFFYYQYRLFNDPDKEKSLMDLLGSLFTSGLVVVCCSLAVRLADALIQEDVLFNLDNADRVQVLSYFYHIQVGFVVVFITKVFLIFKRLILFQKSAPVGLFWNIFEYSLFASLLLNFFYFEPLGRSALIILSYFAVLTVVLSSNLRWVAYLTLADKWRSIAYLLAAVGFCAYFVQLFHEYYYINLNILFTDLKYSVYVWSLSGFVMSYAVFSVLVLLFNLPTSSVFEKKSGDLADFQQLTQTLQVGQDERKMYELLLESTLKTTAADAAWLEVRGEKGNVLYHLQKNLTKNDIYAITIALRKNGHHRKKEGEVQLLQSVKSKFFNRKPVVEPVPPPYQAVLEVPLQFQEKNLGNLVLLKKEREGFEEENIEIVSTFARLAGVAIENARLVEKALENERYQEALTIARRVQQKLLPEQLLDNEHFEMSAFSQTAEEVGGDYYDLFYISPERTSVIIADVSGKGTQAAFYMAQLKGIFQSLAELDFSPERFMQHANSTLSRSLEKSYFVTASFFLLDTDSRQLHFSRAGHCPTLYFHCQTRTAEYISDKGLALGIMRQKSFGSFVETHTIRYQSGDMLLLYTDGVIEAKNAQREEYGYEKLRLFVETNAKASVHQFTNSLLDDLHRFCGNQLPEDDYTVFLIRFL